MITSMNTHIRPQVSSNENATSAVGLLLEHYGDSVAEQRMAVWCNSEMGLDARALEIIHRLVQAGIEVSLHLADATDLPTELVEKVQVSDDKYEATRDCDCLVVLSKATEYIGVDPGILSWHMRGTSVFDTCSCLQRDWFAYSAFHIHESSPALPRARRCSNTSLPGETGEGRFPLSNLLSCAEA